MLNDEIVQSVCAGLLGFAFYIRFLMMFGEAAWHGVFIYRLGEIHGKPARVIGIIGLLGMVSILYVAVGDFLDTQLPLLPVAAFFLFLAVVMVLVLSIFGIFRLVFTLFRFAWRRKSNRGGVRED